MAENFFTPWADNTTTFTAADMNSPISELDRAITYNRPAIVSCDGDITWDSSTGTLAWSGTLRIIFNRADGTAILNTVAAGSVVLADGQFAKVQLSEYNETALTVYAATATPGSASNFLDPQIFILAYRNAASDALVSIGLRDMLPATVDLSEVESGIADINAELETARQGEATLDDRLDAMEAAIATAANSGPVTSVAGRTGDVTIVAADISNLAAAVQEAVPFTCSITPPAGPYTDGKVLATIAPTIACSIAAVLAGSIVIVGENPTAEAVASLTKNGTEFGTITVGTDGTVTLASTSGASLNGTGDYMEIVAPSTADTTLSFDSINIAMTRG